MGAVLGCWVMNTLCRLSWHFWEIASPVGVIVSHVIVLFDFIEEMHAKGKPLETAVIDVGMTAGDWGREPKDAHEGADATMGGRVTKQPFTSANITSTREYATNKAIQEMKQ